MGEEKIPYLPSKFSCDLHTTLSRQSGTEIINSLQGEIFLSHHQCTSQNCCSCGNSSLAQLLHVHEQATLLLLDLNPTYGNVTMPPLKGIM
jgi:hypothetical protein